jgi:predicted TIM-barrel fold metal-dependent hydrolase
VRYLAKNKRSEKFAQLLNNLNRRSNDDLFDRYASFINQGIDVNQEDILRALMGFYPETTKFIILTMDMEYMNAGDPKNSYIKQLDEIVALLGTFGNRIIPFVFADPRRKNLLDFVKSYIDKGFKGIKIYPPLGYFPFEKRLFPVYEYAIEYQIPIMTHCSKGGVYTRERKKSLPKVHPITGEDLIWKNRKEYTDQFTDPDNFEYLLKEYNDLKICFGHFGGINELRKFRDSTDKKTWESSWFNKIKKLLREYPNTYADVSYTLSDLSLIPLINITLLSKEYSTRILFGTDFYMNKLEGNEFKFTIELRNALGEQNFQLIAATNPQDYLRNLL